ncbi:hypothetical protein BKA66DRAFT_567247 [Pyrenochaeta sp. MPI-SDFR-AT-0127]|nr:hypothetical protein BKA66DRAFT_567247 [Pyrenochaeta sp. MPI-SDFR-AT-0127]
MAAPAIAKPCSATTTAPAPCDYDRWHQERKSVILPSAQVDITCWDLGRSVAGNVKWFYVRDRECWVNSRAFGSNCETALPRC